MMDFHTAQAHMPLVLRMMEGNMESLARDAEEEPRHRAYSARYNRAFYDPQAAPPGSVAIHAMIGTITKYGGWCTRGTEDLMREMEEADQMANIAGHVIEIDSGGGEGTNLETVANHIRYNIQKPVVAWYNGYCCSAAYWIASAADEVYASEPTDVAGSIGVYMTFMDLRKYYEEKGITLHEVYADQSTEKNHDMRAARDGEYEIIKNNFLNPYAQRFIDMVREMRPGLAHEDAPMRGGIYMSQEAQKLGLIDGVMTRQQAILRVNQLADARKKV